MTARRNHRELRRSLFFSTLMLFALATLPASGDEFQGSIQPFVTRYCVKCHNDKVHKGELNLTRYAEPTDVAADFRRWKHIIEFIRNGEMPPAEARQPDVESSNAAVEAIEKILLGEALKHAGDPGVVPPRRLSNTEYDTAIRDLTGVDIRPTRDFPVDPAGGEGFDNTGEALRTSPNLVKKQLAAAQFVADHLVLKPTGISFAPFPVTSYNERKKLTEQAVIDFYEQHEVDTMQYLEAAWRYRYRNKQQQKIPIEEWAKRRDFRPRLSGKYLGLVWKTLNEAEKQDGFLQEVAIRWNAIPEPTNETHIPDELRTLHDCIEFGRNLLTPQPKQLIKAGAGNWPISHLDYRTRVAESRDQFESGQFNGEAVLNLVKISAPKEKDPKPFSVYLRIDAANAEVENYVIVEQAIFSKQNRPPKNEAEAKKHEAVSLRNVLTDTGAKIDQVAFGVHPRGDDLSPDAFVVKAPAIIEIPVSIEMQRRLNGKHLLLSCQLDSKHSREGGVFIRHLVGTTPTREYGKFVTPLMYPFRDSAKQFAASAGAFCNTFPNRFYYVDRRRGLAAGFHLVEGFFRDDLPLVRKVLSDEENAELNRLWRELDFVTNRTETLLRGFVWFERSEREVLHDKRFNFLRSEDPKLIHNDLLTRFEKHYLDKMGVKRVGDTLNAEKPDAKYEMIHGFFQQIRAGLKKQQETTASAEHRALIDLKALARKAYRRPLTELESQSHEKLYRELRAQGQSVEASLRGVLVAVFMSPHFGHLWWRADEAAGVHALNDYELASRLSFFLWSSLPDKELLSAAESGKLQNEDELLAQTRRMSKDERVETFAREFFGQWLRYRDYLQKDPVDAAAFPAYTDELRIAMFEEPTRVAAHLIRNDKPITNLLNSDATFVNRELAKHYGGTIMQQYNDAKTSDKDDWIEVTGLRDSGRGGLPGMAVILTKNSAGERTSPVKRGFWATHHLLGQHFPPPPADVPELPTSAKAAKRTIREALADHVSDKQCAMCHKHFDGLGLAMERFDPIGRMRTVDGAGRKVNDTAVFPGGETGSGIPALIDYIEKHRRRDFVKTICRKFLGYALGRSVILSDQPLLLEMESALEQNDFRFSAMFETVVRSRQFRNRRTGNLPVRSQ